MNSLDEKPTDDQVLTIHSELVAALGRKRDIEKSLIELEIQLYNYETSFLEKYSHGINLIKGFNAHSFLSSSATTTTSFSNLASDNDNKDDALRIFSSSSSSSHKAVALLKKISEKAGASTKEGLPKRPCTPLHQKSPFLANKKYGEGLFTPRKKRRLIAIHSDDSEFESGKETHDDSLATSDDYYSPDDMDEDAFQSNLYLKGDDDEFEANYSQHKHRLKKKKKAPVTRKNP